MEFEIIEITVQHWEVGTEQNIEPFIAWMNEHDPTFIDENDNQLDDFGIEGLFDKSPFDTPDVIMDRNNLFAVPAKITVKKEFWAVILHAPIAQTHNQGDYLGAELADMAWQDFMGNFGYADAMKFAIKLLGESSFIRRYVCIAYDFEWEYPSIEDTFKAYPYAVYNGIFELPYDAMKQAIELQENEA